MRKILSFSWYLLIGSFLIISCSDDPIDEDKSFDQTKLYGKWQQGTVFYVYNSNNTGWTWDTSEGVTEEDAKKEGDEGQTFTWELTANNLIEAHFGERTQRSYVIKILTDSDLEYVDNADKKVHKYRKVN